MKQQDFEQAAREQLRASEQLDESTRTRLHQARVAALNACSGSKKSAWPKGLTAGMGGLVAVSVVLVAVIVYRYSPGTVTTELLAAEDYMAAVEDVELYEELDFYLWLAEQEYES